MKDDHKRFANRGVERNKRPLQNIVVQIEVYPLTDNPVLEPYKFKDLGYLSLSWQYQRDMKISGMFYKGYVTADYIKNILTSNQWSKFCQGERQFIIQRRIDGKNIKLN